MTKLKIIWQNVYVFVKKHWLICAGSFGFVVLLLLFLPIFRSSWLLYPESLRARIAIQKLSSSNETAFYCREDCQAKRLMYKNIISSAVSSAKLLPDLEDAILRGDSLPEIRALFIQIWQGSGNEPSNKLKDYFANSSNNFAIRAELARAWPDLANTSFYAEAIGNYKAAKTDAEKIEFLSQLYGRSEPIIINTIWEIILGDSSYELKAKAWFLLANIENKQQAYLPADVDKIRAVLESADYPHRLKDQAIFILADYHPFAPEASELLLSDVVSRTKYFDDYQRSFAVDILNRSRSTKIPGPELSQVDWDNYFNN